MTRRELVAWLGMLAVIALIVAADHALRRERLRRGPEALPMPAVEEADPCAPPHLGCASENCSAEPGACTGCCDPHPCPCTTTDTPPVWHDRPGRPFVW